MRIRTLAAMFTLTLMALFTWSAGAAVLADDVLLEQVGEDEEVKTFTTDDGEVIVIKGGCNMETIGDGEGRMLFKVNGCEEGDFDVQQLIQSHCGSVERTFLGVQLNTLTPELQVHFGGSEGTGVMVSKVLEGTPAEAAGLQVGDVITAVNGTAATSVGVAANAVREMNAGDTALVEVLRNGSPLTVDAVLVTKEISDNHFNFDFDFDHLGHDVEGLHKCVIKLQDEDGSYSFQTENLDEAMEKLNLYLEGPEFEALIEKHGADGECSQKRIEILEEKVEEME